MSYSMCETARIICRNPAINSESSFIEERVLSLFVRDPLPDHVLATLSMTHSIERGYDGKDYPLSRIWIDFTLKNDEPFFLKDLLLGDDLREADPHHQGFCIECGTYGPASFADDSEHALNGSVSFSSRFNSELYAEIHGNSVDLCFCIDDSFFDGVCPDCGSIDIETTVTRQQFVALSEAIRKSIPSEVRELSFRQHEEYLKRTNLPVYQGGFIKD